jgi:hypothetical protein
VNLDSNRNAPAKAVELRGQVGRNYVQSDTFGRASAFRMRPAWSSTSSAYRRSNHIQAFDGAWTASEIEIDQGIEPRDWNLTDCAPILHYETVPTMAVTFHQPCRHGAGGDVEE